MPKIINVTLPDAEHNLLEQIKKNENLANNAEALVWVIRKAARATKCLTS